MSNQKENVLLLEIKNKIAKKYGWRSWNDCIIDSSAINIQFYVDEIVLEYCKFASLELNNEAFFNLAPFTGDMLRFLLVNALRGLTEEQKSELCFDLYCRTLTEVTDEKIKNFKNKQQDNVAD